MSQEEPTIVTDDDADDPMHPMPELADHLTAEEANDLLEDVTVEVSGDERSLAALMQDLAIAHKDLDNYKSGALKVSTAIDERMVQAEMDGDDTTYAMLRNLKRTAFGVYLRLQRGDQELTGDRDGKYSGYFAAPEDTDEE